MTLVCVPILVRTPAEALADAQQAKELGADLVEFRIDAFFTGTGAPDQERAVFSLVARSPLPCILTCRSAAEGGHYDGPEEARAMLLDCLARADHPGQMPPRYIDVEHATYASDPAFRALIDSAVRYGRDRRAGASLILSLHDFGGRPTDLSRRLVRMCTEPAGDVVKIAYRARTIRDNLELLDLIAQCGRPAIALGMGPFGLMSRVLAPKFGALLTFASLREGAATAPGQPTLRELLGTYRFRSIFPTTRVYGVVGWPVGHSLSPLVHNAGFTQIGYDGVYVPLPVQASNDDPEATFASLKATLLELLEHPRLNFAGCSVTVPHKEALVRLADQQGWEIDPVALAIGAGNTLVVGGTNGKPLVCNTDVPAAVEWIRGAVGDLAGVSLGVLGAGGLARAVTFGAARAGAEVTVFNRSLARAERLVHDLAPVSGSGLVRVGDWERVGEAQCRAWVNCTSVGMEGGPAPRESPVRMADLRRVEGGVVLDAVYRPVRTRLIAEASRSGWGVVDGIGLFVGQAEAQFEKWTGVRPEAGLFERLVREELA